MNFKFLYSEKFFVILISLAAMLFNIAPYAYQPKINPPDKIYVGSFPILYDKPTYLAEMVQGEKGNWKMLDMYTTEPQKPVFLYPLYLGMGHMARITGVSVENIFLFGRFFFGTILLFVVLYFIRYFVPEGNQRKIAYFLALFSSGLGWLNLNPESIDLWIPDAIPIIRFSYFPHIMLANILFLTSLLLIWHTIKNNSTKTAIIAGITVFLLNIVLPFESVFLYALTVSFLLILLFGRLIDIRSSIKNISLFFAISIPSFLYMAYLGTKDPIWKAVEQQNILETPPLLDIFTGYGLILIPAILGLLMLFKKDKVKSIFFSLWLLNVLILTHIPASLYPMQRRFLETCVYIPLAISAGFGMMAIYEHLKQKQIKDLNRKIFFLSIFFLFPVILAGNMQTWYNRFDLYIKAADDPLIYLPKENIEAMEWIRQNTPGSSIVLASFYNSNVIPYFAERYVYAGQGAMTIDFWEKLTKNEDFYSGKYSPAEAFDLLEKGKINYVFYSGEEKRSVDRKQTFDFDPGSYSFLKLIFQTKTVKIYQFINNN